MRTSVQNGNNVATNIHMINQIEQTKLPQIETFAQTRSRYQLS